MAAIIPDAVLGASYTNEITGVTYVYDGMKWVIEGSGGDPHEHEEYVKLAGDEMTGRLSIVSEVEDRETALLYVEPKNVDKPQQHLFQVMSSDGKSNNLVVQDDGELWSRTGWVPTVARHLTPKSYFDSFQGIFKFIEPASVTTGDIPDGHCWCRPDNASTWYVSYKTYNGDRWPIQNWSAATENIDYPGGNTGSTNNIQWTTEETKPKMTVHDLDNKIGIFQAYIKKLYIPSFMEMDGVTEKDPQYLTHVVQIDIDKNQKSNFTRPADGTMLWIRFPPYL